MRRERGQPGCCWSWGVPSPMPGPLHQRPGTCILHSTRAGPQPGPGPRLAWEQLPLPRAGPRQELHHGSFHRVSRCGVGVGVGGGSRAGGRPQPQPFLPPSPASCQA